MTAEYQCGDNIAGGASTPAQVIGCGRFHAVLVASMLTFAAVCGTASAAEVAQIDAEGIATTAEIEHTGYDHMATTTATILADGDLLTLTTATGRQVVIDTSTLPAVPEAPRALGHILDQQALSDSAFLHAWNEIRHMNLEENQFLDRQIQLRHVWAQHIAARDARRQQALVERQARLDDARMKIEQGQQFEAEAEAAYQEALAAFKAEFARTSIVLTNEMIDLLVAGKRDI